MEHPEVDIELPISLTRLITIASNLGVDTDLIKMKHMDALFEELMEESGKAYLYQLHLKTTHHTPNK